MRKEVITNGTVHLFIKIINIDRDQRFIFVMNQPLKRFKIIETSSVATVYFFWVLYVQILFCVLV